MVLAVMVAKPCWRRAGEAGVLWTGREKERSKIIQTGIETRTGFSCNKVWCLVVCGKRRMGGVVEGGRGGFDKSHLGKDDADAGWMDEWLPRWLLELLRARETTMRRMVACGYCGKGNVRQ